MSAPEISFRGWRDSDPKKPTTTKVRAGAEAFRKNRGLAATLCLVNPLDAQTLPPELDGVTIHARNYIHRHEFYLGAERPTESTTA